ncbi:uncharacterized protein N7483_002890 [Penicillium malachiteum]|uniref:uncharacterized protein n=1 Tax=Penicillium malachiteum TaxID=1324776 RepID=UPI0025486F94|nr:uncharacterized protein N7483_002890 [Penicillium malachiteum]KAJ5737765.1 hypothetical protein N7483_002890 [Penicillium malachiteum]
MVFLANYLNFVSPATVDEYICVEIPDKTQFPRLHALSTCVVKSVDIWKSSDCETKGNILSGEH